MPAINESRILILATHGFEQSELEIPRERLAAAGAKVSLATPEGDDIRGWDENDWGDMAHADLDLAEVKVNDYDALVLPGGQINPDILRMIGPAVDIVRDCMASGKVVAAICHGPWMLVEADVVRGRRLTSYPSIRTDLVNAGADWTDRAVVTDEGLVTSRRPADLDDFCQGVMSALQGAPYSRRVA